MRLSDVLPADIEPPPGASDIQVTGITAASAAVAPGAIFAGLPGAKVDGAAFIPDAIARGRGRDYRRQGQGRKRAAGRRAH